MSDSGVAELREQIAAGEYETDAKLTSPTVIEPLLRDVLGDAEGGQAQ